MAKKKHHKKQNFKYGQSSSRQTESETTSRKPKSALEAINTSRVIGVPNLSGVGLSHVKSDVIRVGVLAASFVGAEIVLWVLFNHTGLGASVYHLIQI